MRIDLVTPFAEKDAAKALGARWDPARKTWYVQNVADLAPFQRWIPAGAPAPKPPGARPGMPAPRPAIAAPGAGAITESVAVPTHCGCDVLPWEPCAHS